MLCEICHKGEAKGVLHRKGDDGETEDVYVCEKCLAEGRATLTEEVHHIIRLTPQNITDPAVTINPANLECLCRECHQAEHANDRNGRNPDFTDKYVFTADGLLVRRPPLPE